MTPSRGSAYTLLALVAAAACTEGVRGVGTRDWFDVCETNDQCASGACACGFCTQACDTPNACESAGGEAECIDLETADLTCPGSTAMPTTGVCAVLCADDSECEPGMACRLGACVHEEPGAGTGGNAGAAGGSSRAPDAGRPLTPSAFADVNVSVDFTEPVSLPLPRVVFSGDASDLVGSWVELNFNGAPCTPEDPGSDLAGSVCTHLDIVSESNGNFSGTLYREVSAQNQPEIAGPFAPFADPTVGYPTELGPEQYGVARGFVAGVKYRLFDALVRDGRFSFWVSPLDLWTEWCGAQTPFVWDVRGKREYRCVSQTASESDTDLAKLALCTSAEDLAYCADAYSIDYPCVCLDDTLEFNGGFPQCSLTYCECSATECHGDVRGTSITGTFEITGDVLEGTVTFDPFSSYKLTLVKVPR